MNKDFYRIIFNRVRGLFIVVSDIAQSNQVVVSKHLQAKSINVKDDSIKTTQSYVLKPLVFLSYVALGLVSMIGISYANNIVVDQKANQAQQPTIQGLPNGVTQINIAAPTKGGVSHNKYTQFDVSKNGVILNNSPNGSKTQLAGNINGNASLQNSAKVILNEVNSQNISQLNGYIEVAGQKAQVVIANPAGITCNGCGFINADRATLTTGKPIMEDGKLTGYQVEKGHIAITGEGLKNSGQDYTDLIARSVSVNAELWANKEINIVTGKAKVSADLTKIEKVASATNTEQPEFAVDVSALGGMYAGKIKMVGTETGVGVRNNGTIMASAGTLNISADGKILNNAGGKLKAKQDISLKGKSIVNHGKIASQKNVNLAGKNIENYGEVNAKEQLNIVANDVNNLSKLISEKNILIQSDNITNKETGSIEAKENIFLKGNDIINDGTVKSNVISLGDYDESKLVNTWQGKLIAGELIKVLGKQFFNYGLINGDSANIILKDLMNNQGNILLRKGIELLSKEFINDKNGKLQSQFLKIDNNDKNSKFFNYGSINNENIFVKIGKIYNYGQVLVKDMIFLDTSMLENNSKGIIKSDKVFLFSLKLYNFNEILAEELLQINSLELLYNQGKLYSNDTLSILSYNFKNDLQGKVKANQIIFNGVLVTDKNKFEENEFDYQSSSTGKKDLKLDFNDIYNQAKAMSLERLKAKGDNFKNDWQTDTNSTKTETKEIKTDNKKEIKPNDKIIINPNEIKYNGQSLTQNVIMIDNKNSNSEKLDILKSHQLASTFDYGMENLDTIKKTDLHLGINNSQSTIDHSVSNLFQNLNNNNFINGDLNMNRAKMIISNITDMIIFSLNNSNSVSPKMDNQSSELSHP